MADNGYVYNTSEVRNIKMFYIQQLSIFISVIIANALITSIIKFNFSFI